MAGASKPTRRRMVGVCLKPEGDPVIELADVLFGEEQSLLHAQPTHYLYLDSEPVIQTSSLISLILINTA